MTETSQRDIRASRTALVKRTATATPPLCQPPAQFRAQPQLTNCGYSGNKPARYSRESHGSGQAHSDRNSHRCSNNDCEVPSPTVTEETVVTTETSQREIRASRTALVKRTATATSAASPTETSASSSEPREPNGSGQAHRNCQRYSCESHSSGSAQRPQHPALCQPRPKFRAPPQLTMRGRDSREPNGSGQAHGDRNSHRCCNRRPQFRVQPRARKLRLQRKQASAIFERVARLWSSAQRPQPNLPQQQRLRFRAPP